jgi:hypothetical protein
MPRGTGVEGDQVRNAWIKSIAAAMAASSADADGMVTWVGNHAIVSEIISAPVDGVNVVQQ